MLVVLIALAGIVLVVLGLAHVFTLGTGIALGVIAVLAAIAVEHLPKSLL